MGLLAVIVLTVAIVGAACDPAPPPERNCPTDPDAVSLVIQNRTNWERGLRGMNHLGWNRVLNCNARDWANYMASTGQFVHQDLGALIHDPLYTPYASLGENILVGPNSMDGNTIFMSWWNSAGHRANMLGWYDSIGIVVVRTASGRTWAVQEFGRHF